jgi:Bifunctional DNA primase/polymerase, N-terminal
VGISTTFTTGRGLWSRNSPDKSELSKRLGHWAIGLTDDLGFHEILRRYAQGYHQIGWALTFLNSQGTAELKVNGGDGQNGWLERLNRLITAKGWLNLGVQTGSSSRLLVLEVTADGISLLDPFGAWRSPCVAQGEDGCEQHFFTLPPGYPIPHTLMLPARTIKLFGEGGTVLVPPSIDPDNHAPWRWHAPPWENPPEAPSPALWHFLRAFLTKTGNPAEANPPQPPPVEWGQYTLPRTRDRQPLSPEEHETLVHLKEMTSTLYRHLQESPQVAAFKAALCEHLAENPDMAADLDKVEMLQYCLFTYCRINPDFADFTIKERVQEAGKMASEFLHQLTRYMQNCWERRDPR